MIKILLILSVLLFPSLNVRAFENISAKAYVLMEQSTGTVILEKNSKVKMKPASTTKILTAVCAIENAMLSWRLFGADAWPSVHLSPINGDQCATHAPT